MATSRIQVSEGSGKSFATNSISEDSVTKELSRVVINNSSGTELGTSGSPIKTDPTGTTTQPVSISSLPLPSGSSTSDNQTNGSQKTQIVDAGGEAVTVTGGKLDVNATASLAGQSIPATGATEAVTVQVVDGSGNQIASFGGGTQYTEGDTDASLTGTVTMVEGAANAVAAMTQPLTDTQLRATAVPISGTVTAELSATDNAVLDQIELNQDSQTALLTTIDADTSNLSGILADTTAILADTAAIQTAVEALDNAVDGNYLNVNMNIAGTDVVSGSGTATGALRVELPTNGTGVIATVGAVTAITNALPAGTNAIGKLAANSGVDIGDVDVTSVISGTGATNLGKAEDAAHTTGDTGVYALGVRNDTPNTALTNTDADYGSLTIDRVGGIRTALYETDFAVLGTNHVKKYYTNAGAVTDGIVWSPAAGKRWYVTDIVVNTSAAATVTFEDDLGAGDSPVLKMELAANSGFVHHFGTPLFSGEDAADLLVTTTAGNIYITITGYEI